jgi:thiamine pyrophosphokinase
MKMNQNKTEKIVRKYTARLFLNGCYPEGHLGFYQDEIKSDDSFLIAADGGLQIFEKLNITPDLILGDFDSFDKSDLTKFKDSVQLEIPPENKMYTDCEFALQWCVENGIKSVVIYGGIDVAFETDHLLGNIFAMFAYKENFESIRMRDFCQEIIPLEDESFEGEGKIGDFVSLVQLSDEMEFNCTGLKYDPGARVYRFGQTTPLRNQFSDTKFTIELSGRALLVAHF